MHLIFLNNTKLLEQHQKNKADLEYFNNTYFKHPSYQPRKQKFTQGVQCRNLRRLAKIST